MIEKDETSGETRVTVIDDGGITNLPKIGWQHGSVSRHYFTINDDDPNSCRMHTHWTTRARRPDDNLNVRTETKTTLTSTATEFHIEATLEAFEADGQETGTHDTDETEKLVYSKKWSKSIKRVLN